MNFGLKVIPVLLYIVCSASLFAKNIDIHDKVWLVSNMVTWNNSTKEFYADPNNLKENYWYYKISDKDISSEEISEIKQNLKTE